MDTPNDFEEQCGKCWKFIIYFKIEIIISYENCNIFYK